MTGTFINGGAILLGGILGLTLKNAIPPSAQDLIKSGLGVFTLYAGFCMIWAGVSGSFGSVMKQLGIIMLALVLGNIVGKVIGIQRRLNRLGNYAQERFSKSVNDPNRPAGDGFVTCTLIFCVGPMAILGSLQDGLTGDYKTLAIKSVMDGLATMAFASTFGSSVLLAALPVVAYQGTLTLGARWLGQLPALQDPVVMNSLTATGGMLVFMIPLIIMELKKVPLADYIPSLAIAPLLAYWWK
ncbi:MAG TPA: DUF554 domain-containing protein [Roseimicrobium sp.]|nr:DUF554 domain-containing protein [Roseimicrobium sp.]